MIDLTKLRDQNENVRRWEIIAVSKEADANSIDVLIEAIDAETPANIRHIVRALGNIGGVKAERKLLALASTESGEALGDIFKALGQLKSKQAIPVLKEHHGSNIQWVSQNVRWALKQIEKDS